jgi:hypothetical protein
MYYLFHLPLSRVKSMDCQGLTLAKTVQFDRFAIPFAVISFVACTVLIATATAQQPVMYEVQINGESFRVEGNRQTTVTSATDPKVKYNIAIRVDPVQVLSLNKVRLDYENPVTIEDNKKPDAKAPDVRFVKLSHNDGYSLALIDPGQKFDEKQQGEAIEQLTKSTTERLSALKATDVQAGKLLQGKFGNVAGPWRMIRFKDAAGKAETSMLFVLSGDGFTVSCVGEFADDQAADAKPWIGNAVKSLRAVK